MDRKKAPSANQNEAQAREARLKAALKANMGRRKAQARARTADSVGKDAAKNDEG